MSSERKTVTIKCYKPGLLLWVFSHCGFSAFVYVRSEYHWLCCKVWNVLTVQFTVCSLIKEPGDKQKNHTCSKIPPIPVCMRERERKGGRERPWLAVLTLLLVCPQPCHFLADFWVLRSCHASKTLQNTSETSLVRERKGMARKGIKWTSPLIPKRHTNNTGLQCEKMWNVNAKVQFSMHIIRLFCVHYICFSSYPTSGWRCIKSAEDAHGGGWGGWMGQINTGLLPRRPDVKWKVNAGFFVVVTLLCMKVKLCKVCNLLNLCTLVY